MFKNSLFWGGVLFMFFVAALELVSSKIDVLLSDTLALKGGRTRIGGLLLWQISKFIQQ